MDLFEDELIQLRNKNEANERNLRCLMVLGYRAAEDYDRLHEMFEENHKQFESLKKRCQEAEAKLLQLQKALVPACEEYNQLNMDLQIETACRTKLEVITAEVTKENRKLKHQSRSLIDMLRESKCDLKLLESIDDESSAETISSLDDLDALNEKIKSLEDDVQVLQEKLQSAEAETEAARKSENEIRIRNKKLEAELLKICQRNVEHEQLISNLKRSSVMALEEFDHMRDVLEEEILLKERAEEYAHEMLVQRDTIVRQSTILLTSAMSDSRVMHALNEIEQLNKELETVKKEHLEKVKILEEQISSSEDIKKIKYLEAEYEIASSEITHLHQTVQELEEWKLTALEEMKELRERIHHKAEETLLPPPSPPPPPPLPLPTPFLGPKLLIVKKSSEIKTNSAKTEQLTRTRDAHLVDAMNEMITRIKSGVVLKKGVGNSVKTKAEPPKAIHELQNILKTINITKSDDGMEDSTAELRSSSKSKVPPSVLPKPRKFAAIRTLVKPPEAKAESELEKVFSKRKACLIGHNGSPKV